MDAAYDIIAPLRILALKDKFPEKYKLFQMLESSFLLKMHLYIKLLSGHLEKRKENEEWVKQHLQVINILQHKYKLEVSKDEVLYIYGRFYTNDFSSTLSDGSKVKKEERNVCNKL